jgi:hypothetical protein
MKTQRNVSLRSDKSAEEPSPKKQKLTDDQDQPNLAPTPDDPTLAIDLAPPARAIPPAVKPSFGFGIVAKSHMAMLEILMYDPIKYLEEDEPISRFLTPTTIAPNDSPLAVGFCELATSGDEPSKKWISSTLDQFESISVDGKEIFMSIWTRDAQKQKLNFDELMKLAKPKKVKKSVKNNILEIDAKRIKTREHAMGRGMFDQIQAVAPRGKKFGIQLYKMYVLKEGGEIVRHLGKPHAQNHYATLMIPLPVMHTGGEFILEVEEDEEMEFPLSSKTPIFTNPYVLFLAEGMPYHMNPVVTGERVWLQYDVLLEDDKQTSYDGDVSYYERKEQTTCLIADKSTTSPEKFLDLLDKHLFENQNSQICFLLTQNYEIGLNFNNLESGDKKLYDVLEPYYEMKLGYAVNPIISNSLGKFGVKGKGSWSNEDQLYVMSYEDTNAFEEFLTTDSETVAPGTPETTPKKKSPLKSPSKKTTSPKKKHAPKKEPCTVFLGSSARFNQIFEKKFIPSPYSNVDAGQKAGYVYSSWVLSIGPRKSQNPYEAVEQEKLHLKQAEEEARRQEEEARKKQEGEDSGPQAEGDGS